MTTVGRPRPWLAAWLLLTVAACTNVPEGFGSGEFTVEREVDAPTALVWEAARDYMRDRGDAPEVIPSGDGGLMRTGDLRIQVEPGDEGKTRLQVHQATYIGKDYEARANAIANGIIARIR